MSLMTCENVAFSYEGITAVSGLLFQVEKGDYLCIVGENGSGKSTLMKGLLQLKQPSEGKISFGDGLKKSEIGYLPQQSAIQRDFPASVREIVLSGCLNSQKLLPFYSSELKKRAEMNMKKLGIMSLQNQCYRELSGGQQQRVLLARALCASHSILLLDEPVAGLDPVVSKELYQLIAQINQEGMTVIMVSHDVAGILPHASHILHLKKHQVFYGTVNDYLAVPAGKEFIGGQYSDD